MSDARENRGTEEVSRSHAQAGHFTLGDVRESDLTPYTGLSYLAKMFKILSVVLIIMLLTEVVSGLIQEGAGAIPTILGETARLLVLAGFLWGVGDLAILMVDVGHDVRAIRILGARSTGSLKGPAGQKAHGQNSDLEGPASGPSSTPGS